MLSRGLSSLKRGSAAKNKMAAEWEAPSVITKLYPEKFAANSMELKPTGNAPVAGPRVEKALEKGSARFQLYSVATPNGQKAGIVLEEMGVEYDAHIIHIGKGDQFGSAFTEVNPNGKIPALVDQDGPNGEPLHIMESGALLLHMAEQTGKFLPSDPRDRMSTIQWLFWQAGSQGPMLGQFNHFYKYAPRTETAAITYGVTRYGMETQRLMSVLENQLQLNKFVACDDYTIADMAIYPWAAAIVNNAEEFLETEKYPRVNEWVA
ncbi:Disulfide-bond oxidoreductase YghU (GSH-dependent disulfide-bond oxidoreductase YghU) (GST N2-2) (Organic hydroperoxidase), partial [Durusdinium trenchii]